MGSVRVFQVDAFTSQRFAGNPAGVVLDADALSLQDMRRLARELGSADSAFVLAPDAEDHDLRVRFLTPRGEAAFIGHATLAVHAVLALVGSPPRPRQKQAGGVIRVDVLASGTASGGSSPTSGAAPGGGVPRIAIHQPAPPLRGPLDAELLSELLDTLTVAPSELDPRCPPMLGGTGSTRVLLGVDAASTLARLTPDYGRLAGLSQRLGAPGIFVFTLRPRVPQVLTEARMFCPALGFPEDPVSGNAHALLGAYLLQLGLLAPNGAAAGAAVGAAVGATTDAATGSRQTIEFTGAQGHHLDRAGQVTVALSVRHATLESVSIAGEAVIAFATQVQF